MPLLQPDALHQFLPLLCLQHLLVLGQLQKLLQTLLLYATATARQRPRWMISERCLKQHLPYCSKVLDALPIVRLRIGNRLIRETVSRGAGQLTHHVTPVLQDELKGPASCKRLREADWLSVCLSEKLSHVCFLDNRTYVCTCYR